MQNTLFLDFLRPIFALKTKIAPPMVLGIRLGKEPGMKWTRKTGAQLGWRPFFFFGDHLTSAGKTVSILVKTFFFEITWFWQKNRSNLIQHWWNFGSSWFTVVSSFQKSPPTPLCEFLAPRVATNKLLPLTVGLLIIAVRNFQRFFDRSFVSAFEFIFILKLD